MKRLELFANQSIRQEIVAALEARPGARYSLVPTVHGKGGDDWKWGTTVWPEENFMLISYLEDADADAVLSAWAELKRRFPREGMVYFALRAD